MKLIRYNPNMTLDPVGSFNELREDLDRLFGFAAPSFRRQSLWTTPCPINLYRDEDNYVLRAEVPGYDKKDLSLEVVDRSLVLSGHSHHEAGKKETAEQRETRFTRTMPLPDEVDASKIKAEYVNGVLTVTLPKRPEVKPRQIAIEVK